MKVEMCDWDNCIMSGRRNTKIISLWPYLMDVQLTKSPIKCTSLLPFETIDGLFLIESA